ncbi:secretion protein HlyD [Clostridium sp. W14A]|nr:secretion protein HlyD [Clostridium sp. W14A]
MKNWITKGKEWAISHRKTVLLAAGALAALLVAFGVFNARAGLSSKTEDGTSSGTAAHSGEIDAWGEVKYSRSVDVIVDFPSIVTNVDVKEGDRVTLGQPLVTLDLSEYQAALTKLQGALSANQAGLSAATQDTAALEADIAETQSVLSRKTSEYHKGTSPDLQLLQNSLALTQKEVTNAKQDVQSYQALYNSGAVAKSVLDQYTDALDQKQKALTDVQNNLTKTKNALKDEIDQLSVSLKSKQAQLAALNDSNTANQEKQKSGISSAQADLDVMTAKTQKDYLKGNQIVSDLKNGIVQNIAVSDADHLGTQNQPTKVLQLIDADSLTVSAEVDEEFIGRVQVGETVQIVPTSAPDASLSGTVTQIPSLAVEKDGKRVVRVLVKPKDPKTLLKPGYTADVYFPVK